MNYCVNSDGWFMMHGDISLEVVPSIWDLKGKERSRQRHTYSIPFRPALRVINSQIFSPKKNLLSSSQLTGNRNQEYPEKP